MADTLRSLAKRDLASVSTNQEKRRQWDGKLLAEIDARKAKREKRLSYKKSKKKMFYKSKG